MKINSITNIISRVAAYLPIAPMQYIIKGLIILVACSLDMRKYLVRK